MYRNNFETLLTNLKNVWSVDHWMLNNSPFSLLMDPVECRCNGDAFIAQKYVLTGHPGQWCPVVCISVCISVSLVVPYSCSRDPLLRSAWLPWGTHKNEYRTTVSLVRMDIFISVLFTFIGCCSASPTRAVDLSSKQFSSKCAEHRV